MSIEYRLSFKIKGHNWKVFDSYKNLSDPNLKEYYYKLLRLKHIESIKVAKIKTTIELIDFEGDEKE